VLVEFAVVLPVLILIILGILYFARYEDYANQETQLAEEGVRYAAVDTNPSSTGQTLQQYILSQATGELANGSTDVTSPAKAWIYNPSNKTSSTTTQGGQVRVCIAATVSFPSPIGTPSAQIVQTATMRVEVANTSVWSISNNSTSSVPSYCP
jgi:Flp pilus assembly protein TadG